MAIPLATPQSGTLVPSFGDKGMKQIDFGLPGSSSDLGEIVRTDSDGKIWIAGSSSNGDNNDFSIVRLNADGSLDSTFGENGKRIIPVGNGDDHAYGLDLGNVGTIRLIGRSGSSFSVVQLKYDGTLDSTFSDDGKVLIPAFSNFEHEVRLGFAIDADGKILIAGGTDIPANIENQRNWIIVRLNPDGILDSTFASEGKLLVPVDSYYGAPVSLNSAVCAMAIDTNNKIVIAGNSYGENGMHQMTLIRIDDEGTLDSTFDGDGKLDLQMNDANATCLVLDNHGKIVVGGIAGWGAGLGNDFKFLIARLNDDGSFDNTFDLYGSSLISVGGNGDIAYALAIDDNDNILLAGFSNTVTFDQGTSLVRLKPNGSPDSTFNVDGKKMIRLGTDYDLPRSIILYLNGKILVAGSASNGTNYDFGIARLNAGGCLDSTFNDIGIRIIPLGYGNDIGKCVALDANGKLLIAGNSFDENNIDFGITRLNSNGSLDKTFNNTGKLILPIGNGDLYMYSDITNIAQDANGSVLVAGSTFNGTDNDFGVVRLKYNGMPDSSFDEDGKALLPVGNFDDYVYGINLDYNDKIILFGRSFTHIEHHTDSSNGSIIRLNTDGSPDLTFNENGKLNIPDILFYKCLKIYPDNNLLMAAFHTDVGSTVNAGGLILYKVSSDGHIESSKDIPTGISLQDVVMDKRANLLVLGAHGEHGFHQHLNRYLPDGSIDSTFGSGGSVEFPQSDLHYSIANLEIIDSSRIFLAGTNSDGFKLLCLKSDGSIDTTFGQDGKMIQTEGNCSAMALDSNFIWLAGSVNGDYKIVKLFARNNQDIEFYLEDTVQFGVQPLKLAGVASSGLFVSYSSSDLSIASIKHDTLHINAQGTVTITARQGGDGSYYAADPVSRNLVVKSNITDIRNLDPDKEIRLYPNPVSATLFLESRSMIKSATVTGVDGRLLYKANIINDHHFKINMSNYKPGCFIITIQLDNDSAQVHKVLKY